ncbi:MAG: cold-shock protein [Chloroflexi bacterium]|nr:cold-shock protein [Chloroflexota bacterium]
MLVIAREGGSDVFVNGSAVQSEDFRNLYYGQKMEFEVEQGNQGTQATTVTI